MAEGSAARVAVTGANSHLGRALLDRLAARGAEAIALSSTAAEGGRPFHLEAAPADGLLDGADVVVHAAWDLSARDADRAREVNVAGSRRLLDVAARAGARVLFVSSLAAYEGTRSAYGATKLEVERAVADAGGSSIRPGLIFGPDVGGMFGTLREQVASRRVVPVLHSPGRLQLVHRSDLAELIVELALGSATTDGAGGPVSVAHPRPHALGDVVATIARALDRRVVRLPVPWRAAYAGLRGIERLGVGSPVGADSVVSLARGPVAEIAPAVAARLRPFDDRTLLQP